MWVGQRACARQDGRAHLVPGRDGTCSVFAKEEVAGGEEGFSEVASHDVFGAADGGQVHAGVPTKQYIDVHRYLFYLGLGQGHWFSPQRRRGNEGCEQLGDTDGIH